MIELIDSLSRWMDTENDRWIYIYIDRWNDRQTDGQVYRHMGEEIDTCMDR